MTPAPWPYKALIFLFLELIIGHTNLIAEEGLTDEEERHDPGYRRNLPGI